MIYNIVERTNEIFSTREIAVGFWLFIILIVILRRKDSRTAFINLLEVLFSKIFIKLFLFMGIYLFLLLNILKVNEFWDISLIKDAIIWVFFIGVLSIFKTIKKGKSIGYFKKMIVDNLKLSIILEFIVNAYTFSLIFEIILIFFVSMLQLVNIIIENKIEIEKEKYSNTYKLINTILAIVGFYVFFNSLELIIRNSSILNISSIVKSILIQPTLTILFIPYLYLVALYVGYENLFFKIRSKKTIDDDIRPKLIYSILLFCNININKVNDFIKRSRILTSNIRRKEDIQTLFKNYRDNKDPAIS